MFVLFKEHPVVMFAVAVAFLAKLLLGEYCISVVNGINICKI